MFVMSKHALNHETRLWRVTLDVLADGRWHALSALATAAGVAPLPMRRFLRHARHLGAPLRFDAARGVRRNHPVSPLLGRRAAPVSAAWHFALDSTNAALLRDAGALPECGRVLLAEHQTQGRGRRGRAWLTPLGGGIALSFAMPRHRLEGAPALPLQVGVAMLRALRRAGLRGAGLKWPNDLMVHGHKLGGILVEGRSRTLVIGVGINHRLVRGWRPALGQAVTCLADEMGARLPKRERVVACILDELAALVRGANPDWAAEFARHDLLAGRVIQVHEASGMPWEGIADGVDAQGALRVRTSRGTRLCHAGEVSVRLGA